MTTSKDNTPSTELGGAVESTAARAGVLAAFSRNRIRRWLWLDERVNEARQKTFASPQPGWLEFEAARYIRDGVVQIGEADKSSWPVLFLERAAAWFLVQAHMARAGHPLAVSAFSESDWEKARQVPIIQEAWNNLSALQISWLILLLGPDGNSSICNLTLQQRKTFVAGLHGFVDALLEPLEFDANRLSRALSARIRRTGIAAVALLAIVWAGWSSVDAHFKRSYTKKPNIALHRPVEVSSQIGGTGEDHSQLVDGDPDTLGFHTLCEGNQFVIIDLGSVRNFDTVVVYNRLAGCQDRAVPLRLDVSSDHREFHQIAEKKEVFDKWVASGLGAKGRCSLRRPRRLRPGGPLTSPGNRDSSPTS